MAGTKLPHGEVQERVDACYNHRYKENKTQRQWLKYCHEVYGDKSEKQYCAYWNSAREKYDESWREKLNKQLDPAVNTLIGLLASEDERIQQTAVNQIFKYTGNEEIKVAVNGQLDIKLNWGEDATVQPE